MANNITHEDICNSTPAFIERGKWQRCAVGQFGRFIALYRSMRNGSFQYQGWVPAVGIVPVVRSLAAEYMSTSSVNVGGAN